MNNVTLPLFVVTMLAGNTALAITVENGSLTGPNDTFSLIPPGWVNLFPGDRNSTPDTEGADGPHEVYNISPDGGTFVAGAHAVIGFPLGIEGIQQTMTGFDVGQRYRIDFYQSNLGFGPENDLGQWSGLANWQLYLDGAPTGLFSDLMEPEIGPLPNNSWFESSITFVATAETLAIGFGPNSTNGKNAFLGIDGIRITEVVPVPAAAWLLLSGIGCLVLRRRPRR